MNPCEICGRLRKRYRMALCWGCWAQLGPEGRAIRRQRRSLGRAPASRGKTCQHCGRFAVCRARGLCHPCYCRQPIRDLYPPQAKPGAWYTGKSKRADPAPHLRPADPDMIEVMQARVCAGQSVRVPGDGTLDGWTPTAEEAAAMLGGCRQRRG